MTFKHQQKCTGNSGSKPTQRHLEVGLARRLRRCNLISDGLRVFEYDAQNRHSKTIARDPDEGSKITYLHNALGQRVFKSEPKVDHVAPNATALGTPFIDWLVINFGWMFAQAQLDATLGQAYVYDDGQLGSTPMLLGEYGNGGTNSAGRAEYIWLPTQDGQAIPIGQYQNLGLHAIHADHLGTPRRVVSANGLMLWQWPYSAFGEDTPMSNLTGITNPARAYTTDAATGTQLLRNRPQLVFNLRFPGQYFDQESNLNYNYFRSYQASQGRYTQGDPIGLSGGLNRFAYVEGNPLSLIDPEGLAGIGGDGAVTVNAYPGPQAGGIEHGRFGAGGSYHVHIRDSQGNIVRMSTETWKPLTPQDQKIFDNSKQIKNYCDSLTDGKKKFLDRVNREVFHKGYPTVRQLERIGTMRGGARVSGKGVE